MNADRFFLYASLFLGLVVGITVHEAAHAVSAMWLGDHRAKAMGRVTLNPFRHMSLLGTLVIFVLHFGWGKPVEVNLYNFRRPRLYYLLSSLAGPFANFLVCLALAPLLLFVLQPGPIYQTVWAVFVVNLILMFVNLIPIPPLDGSKIWPLLIPGLRPVYSGKWSRYWVVLLLIGLYTGILDKGIGFVIDSWLRFETAVETRQISYSPPPENPPEEFFVPAEATETDYFNFEDLQQASSWEVTFVLDEDEFENFNKQCDAHLTELGYRPLKYYRSDPNEPEDLWSLEWYNPNRSCLFAITVFHDHIESNYMVYETIFDADQPHIAVELQEYFKLYPDEKPTEDE